MRLGRTNIGVGATLGVEHLGGGHVGSSSEVGLDGLSLPGLLGEDGRETTTRGDDGTLVGHADHLSARGIEGGTHGGTNGGDVGDGSGILGVN